eukprot:7342957-Prymnesium_polylepis.1
MHALGMYPGTCQSHAPRAELPKGLAAMTLRSRCSSRGPVAVGGMGPESAGDCVAFPPGSSGATAPPWLGPPARMNTAQLSNSMPTPTALIAARGAATTTALVALAAPSPPARPSQRRVRATTFGAKVLSQGYPPFAGLRP